MDTIARRQEIIDSLVSFTAEIALFTRADSKYRQELNATNLRLIGRELKPIQLRSGYGKYGVDRQDNPHMTDLMTPKMCVEFLAGFMIALDYSYVTKSVTIDF